MGAPSFRLEIHNPSSGKTPAPDQLRIVYSEKLGPSSFRDLGFDDLPLDEVPAMIRKLLALGEFDHARDVVNSWFVALAHLYGHNHVTLG